MRISSPPILWPCFYGIDMADRVGAGRGRTHGRGDRRAHRRRTRWPTSRWRACSGRWGARPSGYCRACFTGEYPIPIPDSSVKLRFEPGGPRARSGLEPSAAAGRILPRRGRRPRRRAAPHRRRSRRSSPAARPASPPRTPCRAGMREPMLVTCTDGVGTKLLLAQELGRIEGLGQDLVAMCVNDLACTGARPLVFLDYLAVGRLDPGEAAALVRSIADACAAVGCALAGGETAEMPGLYAPGPLRPGRASPAGSWSASEMLGAAPGARGRRHRRDPLLGLHSNGFSLVRALVADGALAPDPDLLLAPTRLYVERRRARSRRPACAVRAAAHITGGRHPGEPAAGAARRASRAALDRTRGSRAPADRRRPGDRAGGRGRGLAHVQHGPRDVRGRGRGRRRRPRAPAVPDARGGGARGGRAAGSARVAEGPPAGGGAGVGRAASNLQSLIDSVHAPGRRRSRSSWW